MAVFLGGFQGVGNNVLHDGLELAVNLFEGPGKAVGVLAHLKAGNCHAARVRGLSGAVEHVVGLVDGDCLRSGRHVGAFAHHGAAVGDKGLGGLLVDLVLGGARQGDVARNGPHALAALVVLGARHALCIFLDAAAMAQLDVLDHVKLNAVRIVDVAVGIGGGHNLRAEGLSLLGGEDGHVAGAGNDHGFAFKRVIAQHAHCLGGVVAQAVTGGLSASQGAAEFEALAGEHAGILVADALVLAEQVADLAAAHVDVAGRNVGELADMTAQFRHEGLAETHDFGIRLALRVEVGAALSAAHRQAGQGVLQNLLEAEELDDALVHARMETQAALVRADSGVELDAVTTIDLHLALIVGPCDAELYHAFRFDNALEHTRLLIFRMLRDHRFEAFENLANGLQEFRLVAVALLYLRVHALDVLISEHILPLRDS